MKIKPVVERQSKFYIPKLYVNSVEIQNNIVTVHYYLRDTIDEEYNFDWFDDKKLLKNLRVTMTLDVDGAKYNFAHSLYELTYDYKDIKLKPQDFDAFGERSYYFELSKQFVLENEIINNCLLTTKIALLQETDKQDTTNEIISSDIENIQVLKDNKIPDQFYYETESGEVYLGSVKQVGQLYLDINNRQLKKINSNINYTVKDLRNLLVTFPKFKRLKRDETVKNKKDIIFNKNTKKIKRVKRILDTAQIVQLSSNKTVTPRIGLNARFKNPFIRAENNRNVRDINSPEVRNRDLLTGEIFIPIKPQIPFKTISEEIEVVSFEPTIIDNNINTIPDIFLSVTSDKRVHGLFAVDIENILFKNSEFFQYISGDSYYKNKALRQSLISNLKVYRYKIPNSEQERKAQARQLIASSKDSDSDTGYRFNSNDSIKEIVGLSSKEEIGKRYFTFSDNTILLDEVGTHYYEIEIEVSDYAKNLIAIEFKDILDSSIKQIEKYLESITRYAKNPKKPLFPKEAFFEIEYPKYESLSLTIQNIAYIYAFLSKKDISEFVKKFSSLLHPLSTNIFLINLTLETLRNLLRETEKVIKFVDDITNEINSAVNLNKTESKFIIKEIKKFNRPEQYINLSFNYGTGLEFFDLFPFDTRSQNLANRTGILSLNEFQFTNRIEREVNKYVDKNSANLSGKNSYITTTFLDLQQNSYNFINSNNGSEYTMAFYAFYSYFGNTENVTGLGGLFNVLSSQGIFIRSIDSKNNVSSNDLFPNVVADNNPDSKTASEKYLTDTKIDTLFISLNKDPQVIEQFKSNTFLNDSYIGISARQKVVDSVQQSLSRFIATERTKPEDYCRTFMTYGSIVKITEVFNGLKYKLYKLDKDIGVKGINSEINKYTFNKSDISFTKNIPVCDEYFIVDKGIALQPVTPEKIVDIVLFEQFNKNTVKPEYMKTMEPTEMNVENKIRTLLESI